MSSRRRPAILVVAAAMLALGVTCTGPSSSEISRERAIDIARQQVSFQPDSVDAEQATAGARPVWRVTLRGRLPGQPPGLFETAIIEIDRRTGEVVSVART
jgi:hypothetical protein